MPIIQELIIKMTATHIGSDQHGNKYYESQKQDFFSRKRRYVIYNGMTEPSKVTSEWYGWLHHLRKDAPHQLRKHPWQTERVPNLTGTKNAYFPNGANGGKRDSVSADYTPWLPK